MHVKCLLNFLEILMEEESGKMMMKRLRLRLSGFTCFTVPEEDLKYTSPLKEKYKIVSM